MITYRNAKPKDAEQLNELMFELVKRRTTPAIVAKQLQLICSDPHYFLLVAEQDGSLVGSAMCVLCHDICEECLAFSIIENVIVSQNARGLGVGRELMARCEEWAREQGAGFVELVSSAFRTGAHRFYESIGYQSERGFRKHFAAES